MGDIVVIGIGNPYRGDDAIGWAVVEALSKKSAIHTLKLRGDIVELMDVFVKYPSVYIVDACSSDKDPAGTFQRIDVHRQPLWVENNQTSTHGFSVSQAVALAKNLDELPARLIIYAISGDNFSMCEKISPPVAQAIDKVVQAILNEEDIRVCMNKV